MTKTQPVSQQDEEDWLDDLSACVREGKSIRRELPDGGRLHIDRPLPFLCVHIAKDGAEPTARDIAQANASYLVAPQVDTAIAVINAIASILEERFGAFMLFDIGELSQDRFLTADAPFLPPFDVSIWSSADAIAAADAFSTAVRDSEARFRTPRVEKTDAAPSSGDKQLARELGCSALAVRFAPVYRQPGSDEIYPELRDQLVAMLVDAGLQAFSSFIEMHQIFRLTTHRALGRKAFVDAVSKVDRSIDDIASTFDFLLAVTPINAEAAFEAFRSGAAKEHPIFLYRPLALQVEAVKRKLFSISFDHLEDPVLYQLYREKQQELDLQLSLLSSRQGSKFVEFSRALYGPVEPALLREAKTILGTLVDSEPGGDKDKDTGAEDRIADCFLVEHRARAMIAAYHRQLEDFEVSIELRDDLPSGLLVSGHRLLIARSTLMDVHRIEPLLSHEIGVHLLTYFNGSAQGLRLFRSGLAGYEGMQEGIAVFAEYLAGGMTPERLKLIAGRVVGCASMLDGATFAETYATMVDDYDFSEPAAFNLVLRLYRGGGLAKDAIYLRGLLALLDHLEKGGALEPFWMGKISASHFSVMQELADRGLLRRPAVQPMFLDTAEGRQRLERARSGMRPLDMIQRQEF
ncbi:flavohemoglobin expression-modulating QEGLA motif protein [Neorhizobium sp. T786]|uniref:flavohemoglobin expression-modulating QEGLA motif protein n=1 Tax=Pseudorhizobium xiangyangii TaxID=2883104 RepID=UPI001CFF95AF|nr:flavohemoglobin expression-modulating QEGLA motif protein [Neorhizobium xiangyangii]MCB5204376.1 flavohemoglobin expression-modulating QEGLA motif protein [Neorhizobium xiangyangii]